MLLIISRSKKTGEALSDTFYYMGVLSYAATPKEALSEISIIYNSVVIIEPEGFPDIGDYLVKLKSYLKDVPIFGLSDVPRDKFPKTLTYVFRRDMSSPVIANRISQYCIHSFHGSIGTYKLAGFDASSHEACVTYFGDKVDITRTEAMILRYLICAYPIPRNAETILKYAFRPSRRPEVASIRTHISSINKKLLGVTERKTIELMPKQGYYIMTPEMLEKLKKQ